MSLTPGRSLLLAHPPLEPSSRSQHASPSSAPSASDDDPARTAARKKAMLCALTKPSVHRGYVVCRLCSTLVWGPNGRYHIEKCTVLCRARQKADEEGIKLVQVSGIRIDETLFKKAKSARPKAAKLPGFVISRTVNLENPYKAPSDAERKRGAKTGRKGYVRCLACNAEVYAPNAKHHAAACAHRRARFQ
ncbi:hypothetical protein BWQ96_04376 [Gracilariopsis chorda]|uniref:Uncharacterized protein n=1 Tax=Gracilariopsis chorda TaxID=448386 RepID=A0A2V3IUS6_9FLOR|nr:hypothetical protein BWQ96_04376 [Gracilariopsis chorda]|eukprot:PXF45839.1 hypothetical protein BWQ96_04376 [Gracilariopsis chorda]